MKDPFSLDEPLAPRKAVRKLLEKDVQSRCVAYARSKGYWARKFSSPSQRSVPDFLFGKEFQIRSRNAIAQIKWAEEFKAPDKTSTENQLEEQQLMIDAGWKVIRDTGTNGQADIDAFKRRIDEMEARYG